MPGQNRTGKSRTKSIRIPLDVWSEVEDTAAKRGRTFNEEVIFRVKAGADPAWSPAIPGEQMSLL